MYYAYMKKKKKNGCKCSTPIFISKFREAKNILWLLKLRCLWESVLYVMAILSL